MIKIPIFFLLLILTACGEKAQDPPPTGGTNIPPEKGRKTCEKCKSISGLNHVCGKSRYCDTCMRDVFKNHVCSRTQSCVECAREVGENHNCGFTKICWRITCTRPGRVIEGGDGHVCAKTVFCHNCKVEAGISGPHDCNARTYFCPKCELESQITTHACPKSFFCAICRQERSKKIHECYRTRFCPICKAEGPMRHSHKKSDRSDTPEGINNP